MIHTLEHEEHSVLMIEKSAGCNHQDFLQFLQEEFQYLDSLKADPPELTLQIEYANALKQYYETK